MTEGRIDKALSGFYYVATAAGETLTCRARGKFRKEGLSPLVGYRVAVRELGNGEGYVEEILPRRNAFQRPAVANIDQLVIVASGAIPVTDPFLIDRMSAVAALKDCGVVLLLNKHDLDPAEELYRIMGRVFQPKKGWTYAVISPHEDFEALFGRKADKRRKLYNGMLKCQLYLYYRAG